MYGSASLAQKSTSDQSTVSHDQWSAHLRGKIDDEASGHAWYAVIDPHADADLPGILWKYDDKPDVWPLLMTSMDHEVRMQGPLFVRLYARSPLVDWYLAKSCTQAVGILYEAAPEKSDALFEHLQNVVECSLPDGSAGVFRFYDPRIVYALIQLNETNMQSLLAGPALALYGWEFGRGQALELSGKARLLAREGLPLEQALLDGIARFTMPYAILHTIGGERGDYVRSLPFQKAFLFIDDVCATLFKAGITELQDCAACVSCSLQAGRNLFAESPVQDMLLTRGRNTSLPDVLEHISDQYISTGPRLI